MRCLDIAEIIGQSLNNSVQENYNNNLSNFSLCNIQEFGLESVLSKGVGAIKGAYNKSMDAATSHVNKLGIHMKTQGEEVKAHLLTPNKSKEFYDSVTQGSKSLNDTGDHLIRNASRYATGIVGTGAAAAAGTVGGTGYLVHKGIKSLNNDSQPILTNDDSPYESVKTIGNKAYDSTKGIASDIADHVKEHIGKYALGGTVLTGLTAGGLAAHKYMSRKRK